MTEPKYSPDISKSNIGAIGDYNTVTQNIIQQPGQPSPHRLPQDIADFTGRIDYIQEIEAVLQQGKIVAVNGMGGVGKSALAIHVGHRLKPQFPDAQLYVDLRGQSEFPLEPQQVLIQFLQALTGRDESQLPTDLDGLAGQYRSVLSNQKALIVLDNARDKLQIQPLLPGSASCGVIVTSRQPLGSLPGAQLLQLGAMSLQEGLDYLKQQLRLVRVEAELAAAQEIVELCGRLPLALAIAGGALKEETTWTMTNYGVRLRDEQRRLERLQLDDLDLRASFNLSYARLTETEQQLFVVAGCLPGVDFGEAVVATVLEWPPETTQEMLRRLVRVRVLEGKEGRYQFHDLMRLFARKKLGETEQESILGRALDWYCVGAGFWKNGLNPLQCRQLAQAWGAEREHSQEEWEQALAPMALDWFEAEQGNWVAVMQQLQRLKREDGAVALAANLVSFFNLRSHWADWVTTHEIAKDCAEKAGNRAGVAQTLGNLGGVYSQQGKWQEALSTYEQSLQTKRELGDVHGVAATLGNLGSVYLQQGKWIEAIAVYEQSLETSRHLGDVHGVATTLGNLGSVYYQQGKWQEAISTYEQSLQTKRELGDVHSVAATLTNLGNVYRQQGKWIEAIAVYEQSLETSRQLGAVHGVAANLTNLGTVYLQQGKWQEAIATCEQSLQIFHKLGDVHGVATTLGCLGGVYIQQGKLQEAIAVYKQSLQIERELGDVHGVATTLMNLGNVYRQQGKWPEAIASFEQSLETSRQLGDVHGAAQTLMNLGNVYRQQGKWPKALSAYEQSLETYRLLGDVHGVATTHGNLGNVYSDRGKWPEASASFEQSLQIFHQLGDVPGVAQILDCLGSAYLQQGKRQEALSAFEQSLGTYRQLGDIHGVAQILDCLGSVYRQQGKWPEAIAAYEQSLQTKRELGDVHGVAVTLNNLGIVYGQQGKWSEAIASFDQSLQMKRELGDVHGEGQTLANLGLLYKKRHQPDQAKAHWQEALTKLNPSSPEFQKVQQLLAALNQPQRPNFTRWLIPLGIAVFLVACLIEGQWLWALGGVVVVGAMRWGRGRWGS